VIARETSIRLGCRLTILEYRHVVATIGREFISQEFTYGTYKGVGEEAVEEPEIELKGGLNLQAGRTKQIGNQSYSVSADIIQNLSARSIQFFSGLAYSSIVSLTCLVVRLD
ncbi:hypothetical protein GQ44DRAFT_638908, partial [Phaeosphaeriaceae sp. PMI808]